jgi:hypothetical protein
MTDGWGTVSYWNAYVANLEMHGKGRFYDPRLADKEKYPVAARTQQGEKQDQEDRITSKLAALQAPPVLSAVAAGTITWTAPAVLAAFLIPASSAVPAAAKENQHNNYDEQSRGVHEAS